MKKKTNLAFSVANFRIQIISIYCISHILEHILDIGFRNEPLFFLGNAPFLYNACMLGKKVNIEKRSSHDKPEICQSTI
jgi:hypothetical protein